MRRAALVYWARPMRFIDVIARKRDGHALDREAIDAFVHGCTDGTDPRLPGCRRS